MLRRAVWLFILFQKITQYASLYCVCRAENLIFISAHSAIEQCAD
nr:MAG TPA: hypothetical protein [Caudoviricetes sp.]